MVFNYLFLDMQIFYKKFLITYTSHWPHVKYKIKNMKEKAL